MLTFLGGVYVCTIGFDYTRTLLAYRLDDIPIDLMIAPHFPESLMIDCLMPRNIVICDCYEGLESTRHIWNHVLTIFAIPTLGYSPLIGRSFPMGFGGELID